MALELSMKLVLNALTNAVNDYVCIYGRKANLVGFVRYMRQLQLEAPYKMVATELQKKVFANERNNLRKTFLAD
jgi:hypothetical protein